MFDMVDMALIVHLVDVYDVAEMFDIDEMFFIILSTQLMLSILSMC